MGRKGKGRRWPLWQKVLIILLLVWFVMEGRFYLPRHIRPPRDIQPVEIEMTTTAYCHCRRCCSYKWFLFVPYQKTGSMRYRIKHIGKTSSGAMVRPGSIAADTSIYPYGTVMYVPGYGYGRVEDTGGAINGQHIDLYRPNHWFARKWGVQAKKVKVWLPSTKQASSVNPAPKKMDLVGNTLPLSASVSNVFPRGQGGVSNEISATPPTGITNKPAPSDSVQQIPLP